MARAAGLCLAAAIFRSAPKRPDGQHGTRGRSRIFYFIGASRLTAAIMVSRLLLALYHPSHIFVVHVDLKANDEVMSELQKLTANHPNIHIMATRRLVQWGAWTMVLTMLDALHSVLLADLEFDFVINLSDVDVALRTNEEIVDFLRPYKGRQFVQVHQGSGEWLEKARNFTSAHVVVECGGYGYVAVNSSGVVDLGGGPQCCFGRGGPILYANDTQLHLRDAREALSATWRRRRWRRTWRRVGVVGGGLPDSIRNGGSRYERRWRHQQQSRRRRQQQSSRRRQQQSSRRCRRQRQDDVSAHRISMGDP